MLHGAISLIASVQFCEHAVVVHTCMEWSITRLRRRLLTRSLDDLTLH